MKKCIGCFRLIESHCYNPFILWKSDDVPNWAEAALVEVFEVGCMLFTACLAWSGKDCGSDNIEVSVPIVLSEFDTAGKKSGLLNNHRSKNLKCMNDRKGLTSCRWAEVENYDSAKFLNPSKFLGFSTNHKHYKQNRPGKTDHMWWAWLLACNDSQQQTLIDLLRFLRCTADTEMVYLPFSTPPYQNVVKSIRYIKIVIPNVWLAPQIFL